MIDHLGISVPDFAASKEFYLKALAPLGIGLVMNVPKEESGRASDFAGFGYDHKPFFWIGQGVGAQGMHVCFTAKTRAEVDAFYRAFASIIIRTTMAPSSSTSTV